MTIRISFLSLLLVIGFAGCTMLASSGKSSPVHVDRIYCGRAIGDSAIVSDSTWSVFLKEVVTPAFPDGFTFSKGEGQWKNRVGVIVREQSFILEIVHSTPGEEADSAIERIMAEYKRRFRQESVLHVTTSGKASF
jgi:hypothetical protein